VPITILSYRPTGHAYVLYRVNVITGYLCLIVHRSISTLTIRLYVVLFFDGYKCIRYICTGARLWSLTIEISHSRRTWSCCRMPEGRPYVAEDPQLAGYYKEFVDKLISSYFYPYNVYIRNVSMRCVFIARVLVRLLVLRLPISLTFFKVRQSYCRVIARLDVCPSVRPSACPPHAGIVSKRLNLLSNCLHCLVAPWF